jgi:hypothetical protein
VTNQDRRAGNQHIILINPGARVPFYSAWTCLRTTTKGTTLVRSHQRVCDQPQWYSSPSQHQAVRELCAHCYKTPLPCCPAIGVSAFRFVDSTEPDLSRTWSWIRARPPIDDTMCIVFQRLIKPFIFLTIVTLGDVHVLLASQPSPRRFLRRLCLATELQLMPLLPKLPKSTSPVHVWGKLVSHLSLMDNVSIARTPRYLPSPSGLGSIL